MRVAFSLDLGGRSSWFNHIRVVVWALVLTFSVFLLMTDSPYGREPTREEAEIYALSFGIGIPAAIIAGLALLVYIILYQTSPPAVFEFPASLFLSIAWLILEYRASHVSYSTIASNARYYASCCYWLLFPYSLYVGVVAGRAQQRGVERAWLLQVHSLPEQGRITLPAGDVEGGVPVANENEGS